MKTSMKGMHRKINMMHKQLLYSEKLNKTFLW